MKPHRYTHILLDLDDTLMDFTSAQRVAIETTLSAFEIEPTEELVTQFRKINRQSWQGYADGAIEFQEVLLGRWRNFFAHTGHGHSPQDANTKFLNTLSESSDLLEGALEFCQWLAQRFTLAIVTNGDALTQKRRLERSPLAPFFKQVSIAGAIGYAKPHPEIFLQTLTAMGSPQKSNVLMIGDLLSTDIRGAIAAGIDACWFNQKKAPGDAGLRPTFVAHSYSDIMTWLSA